MFERREPQAISPPVRPVIRLEYTCAARPPEYVDMKALNTFGRDNDGFYWESSGKKYHSEIDFIKMLFTPKGMSWSEAVKIVK
jgi:hypothetical protein